MEEEDKAALTASLAHVCLNLQNLELILTFLCQEKVITAHMADDIREV
jgi:hypothetical protein